MKKNSLIFGSVVAGALILTGCGTEVELSKYPKSITNPVQVPDICKSQYNALKAIPKVAVVKFTNNSSFGVANTTDTRSNKKSVNTGVEAGEAVVASDENTAVAYGVSAHQNTTNSHSSKNVISRTVDPKLDKSITSSIEGMLASMGGADVFSREDLEKVLKEQKLQQSGLMDENTLVKVGKLAGVQYIITGSLDSVTQEYKDYTKMAKTATSSPNGQQQQQSLTGMLFKTAVNVGASYASGMKITAIVNVKVIDVTTGKIVLSKKIKETKNIGKIPNPTYTQVIGGIKGAVSEGLKQIIPDMSDFFAVKGYILQVKSDSKGKDFIAQINLGKANKVKPEQKFYAYSFEKLTDPVSGKVSCSKNRLNVELTVSKNQINQNNSWTVADGDDASKLRAGQIIKRAALDN